MSILWEKSQTWRWIVRMTKESKPFFFTFAAVCGVIPTIIGYGVMQVTNSSNPQLEAHLRQTARPDSLMMGKVNQDRLKEYFGELQRKENTNDRYVAALRGETLTRNPYVRIQPMPNPSPNQSTQVQQGSTTTAAAAEKQPKSTKPSQH
ncbi:uncharacterized protein LOC131144840 [Malania oleifera]|uniref:uncharacterized protein LOC131144840 n=1 Tax=Malania oleifera TaxID=397392 RepID=UPI0025AE6D80|nr:uncharacterized protein LOC131144840 [Malania oleifera]